MRYSELENLNYSQLQSLLNRVYGEAPRSLSERITDLETVNSDQLMIYSEYVRRNVRYGQSEAECITYEDAAKLLIIPVLLRRLDECLELLRLQEGGEHKPGWVTPE
jgi:hypothetical protein